MPAKTRSSFHGERSPRSTRTVAPGLTFNGVSPIIKAMNRALFALWFTITTLIGPWFCCCSLSASPKTTTNTSRVPAPGSVKSCCQNDGQPRGDHEQQCPAPDRPSKCPCEQNRQHATPLLASSQEGVDPFAQQKLTDTFFVSFPSLSAFGSLSVSPLHLSTSAPAPRLAGRSLLAAYSILRC